MDFIVIFIWALLILTLVFELRYTMDRLRSLKAGLRALIYFPVVWIVLIISLVSAVYVSEVFPILKWGWLGYNIVTAPVSEVVSDKITDPSMTIGFENTILFIGIFIIIIYACLLCNYYEEAMYRDSLLSVVIWALLHLIMGISLFMVIPLFFIGIIYKYIYDKYSVDHSYCLHFFTNMSLIGIMAIIFFL